MTVLSQALKPFYVRIGNKIIFKNKNTLNKLALEMWTKMGHSGVDPSTISRVIKGQRLFTKEQLIAFCAILNLKNHQKFDLLSALEQDYLARFGLNNTNNRNSLDVIDLLEENYRHIRYARERGNVSFVMDWADNVNNLILNYLKDNHFEKYQKILQIMRGNVFYEKGFINCSVLPPEQNNSYSMPLIQRLFNLAKRTESIDMVVKAYTILGFTYYALGKYSFSKYAHKFYLKSLTETIKALKVSESHRYLDEFTLIYLRYIALDSIYMNNQDLFLKTSKKIEKIVDKNFENPKMTFVVWALDTVARGQSFFKDHQAEKALRRSREFNKKIQFKDYIREASMLRNEIEVLINLKTKDTNYITNLIDKGIILCKNHNIFRYQSLFRKYLNLI